MLRASLVLIAMIALFCCGCTTMQGSQVTTGTIAVVSTPAGATISVDGTPQGTSPMNITVKAGSHTVDLIFPDGYTWSTPVVVTAGGISQVTFIAPGVTPVGTQIPVVTPTPQKGLILTNMKGYQGGGDYITRISFNLQLAPGEEPIDLDKAAFEVRTLETSVTPYWEITKRQYVANNSVLTSGDLFLVTVSTPRINAGDMFTFEIRPEGTVPLSLTKRVPAPVGLTTNL